MTKEEIYKQYKQHSSGAWFKKRLKFILMDKLPKNVKYRVSQYAVTFWITNGPKAVFGTDIEIYFNPMNESAPPTMNLSSMNINPLEDDYHCQRIKLQQSLVEHWKQVTELCFKASRELIKLENLYQDIKSNRD